MDSSEESDWLLQLAAMKEQHEYPTEQLCQRLIDVSREFRQYLSEQETRLQQLMQHLANDAEAVRNEVDSIYRDIAERLHSFADAITE